MHLKVEEVVKYVSDLMTPVKEEGVEQFFKLKSSGSDYIRSYAQTNLMEFFAVTVECFFETPVEFHEKHPKIYLSIQKLLAQDPRLLEK